MLLFLLFSGARLFQPSIPGRLLLHILWFRLFAPRNKDWKLILFLTLGSIAVAENNRTRWHSPDETFLRSQIPEHVSVLPTAHPRAMKLKIRSDKFQLCSILRVPRITDD